MKKINVFVAVLAVVFFVVSCGKDDAPTTNKPTNVELKDDPSESRPIELLILENGISIKGGKKIEGMPPPPSGTVDFKLDSKTPMGIQKTGFDIEFSSSSNIAGAYVLVQTTSGEKAKSYFDIPVGSLKKNNFIAGRFFKSTKKISAKYLETSEFEANFDFSENVLPGKFCYEICVYDADGNISAIEEKCITVEAWGGNQSISGAWIYDRMASDDDDDDDDFTKIYCENGDSIMVEYYKNSKEYLEVFLGEGGDYYRIIDEQYKKISKEESSENCEAIYKDEVNNKEKYIGNWSYNTKENLVALVDFKYEDLLNPSNNKTYPEGDLVIIAETKLIGDELYFIDEEEEETYIFKRK